MNASIFAANRSLVGGVVSLAKTSSVATNLHFAYTQAGSATKADDHGTHEWTNINWYNNVDGNGVLGVSSDVPSALTTHTERNPNFSDLVVDSRCNDTLLIPE